nr:helix-turn-helix transcriptional regulator [Methylobacterium sp. L1A1]
MKNDELTISSAQCRAARALLGWSREELAEASKVSRAAIADFETDKRQVRERTVDDLREALEAAGVEFIPANGGGAGVRLRTSDAGSEH